VVTILEITEEHPEKDRRQITDDRKQMTENRCVDTKNLCSVFGFPTSVFGKYEFTFIKKII